VKRKRIGGRVYLYAIHSSIENKGGYTSCYLGPKDSYEYVTCFHDHKHLVLKGLLEKSRDLEYL